MENKEAAHGGPIGGGGGGSGPIGGGGGGSGPIGGGGPSKNTFKEIAKLLKELSKLFDKLAKTPIGGPVPPRHGAKKK